MFLIIVRVPTPVKAVPWEYRAFPSSDLSLLAHKAHAALTLEDAATRRDATKLRERGPRMGSFDEK